MPLQTWFWVFYVIGLFVSLWADYRAGQPYPYPLGGRTLLFFVLVGILGWAQFGSAVK